MNNENSGIFTLCKQQASLPALSDQFLSRYFAADVFIIIYSFYVNICSFQKAYSISRYEESTYQIWR